MAEEKVTNSGIPKNIPVLESAPIREELVATAVKFLQNPKVQSSPLQQKRDFMKKKGLTEEEIEKAVKVSGVSDSAIFPVPNQPVTIATPVQTSQPVSGWIRLREYSSITIVVAGVVYGIYMFFKKYIEPIFLRRHKEQEEKLNRMEKSIAELNSGVAKNLQELQTSVNALRDQLTDQSLKLANLSSNLVDSKDPASTGGSSAGTISAIQTELTSVKALLLGTKQFPSTPAVPPVIPSWQMKPASVSGGDARHSSEKSLKQSLDLSRNHPSQKDADFASPALAKTLSKSDLEQESGDESNSSDDLTREVTVNGSPDSLSSPEKFVHLNGHAAEKLNESDALLDSDKLPIGSPAQSSFELSPETGKALGESELD